MFAIQGNPLRADFRILALPALRSLLPVLTRNLKVDVREDKEKNLMSATFELPGVNRESVSVDIHNNLLTVSGESKSESGRSSTSCYLLCERHFGQFSRSFPVPEDVKPEEIKASMENGVLTVTYPRHSKKVAVA